MSLRKLAGALAVAALLCGGASAPWAAAAEAEAAPPERETDGPSAQQGDAAPATEQTQSGGDSGTAPPPSPDVFLPTEEISEDFAAPFPVDV